MLDETWRDMRGVDRDHDTLFQATLIAFTMARGKSPDQHWRALLYLATGDRELWSWLAPRLDFNQGRVHLEDAVGLGGEPQRLLILARHLFDGNPCQVNLAGLLQALSDRNRAVALGAMNEFCA
jgi:hypothetical protein